MGFDINQALALRRRAGGIRPPHQGRLAAGGARPWRSLGAAGLRAPWPPSDTESALQEIASPEHQLAEFEENGEVDFSYELQGVSRFRVNAFRQRGAISIALRAIPFQVRTIDDLGLPEVVRRLAEEPRGIILLTGTTGSGKSTTLAAMIDHINSTRARHIVTMEDPIEYLHRDKLSIINQREVGSDTESFAAGDAARPASGPRRDPDRGDARRGDRAHRAVGGGDRPPRHVDAPHPRRQRDDQPNHRLLPAAPPAAGAGDARLDAEGRDLAAAGAADRSRGPRRRLRGDGRHRAGSRT